MRMIVRGRIWEGERVAMRYAVQDREAESACINDAGFLPERNADFHWDRASGWMRYGG